MEPMSQSCVQNGMTNLGSLSRADRANLSAMAGIHVLSSLLKDNRKGLGPSPGHDEKRIIFRLLVHFRPVFVAKI
jgi:hypothetical protein